MVLELLLSAVRRCFVQSISASKRNNIATKKLAHYSGGKDKVFSVFYS